jgi:hypothetical protein
LVVVRRIVDAGRPYLAASLVDLERGRRLHEARLEILDTRDEVLKPVAVDLSDFLVTGKAAPRLKVEKLPPASRPEPAPAVQSVPELPVHYASRLWYRSWWPYAIAGGAALTLGIGAHLASDYYRREEDNLTTTAGKESARSQANAWIGVAVVGYVLTGAAVVTALVLEFAYKPPEVFPTTVLAPAVGPGQVGLVWMGRF